MKGLREQVATAVNTERLDGDVRDVVAAFGMAQVRIGGDSDAVRSIAGLLWRIRAGDAKAFRPAVFLLTKHLQGRARRRHWQGGPPLVAKFAERVLLEWVEDRHCYPCGGSGYVGLPGVERTFRKGEMLRLCPACGSKKRSTQADEAARAAYLGVTLAVYQKHWADRFAWMLERMSAIDGSVSTPLAAQLEEVPA